MCEREVRTDAQEAREVKVVVRTDAGEDLYAKGEVRTHAHEAREVEYAGGRREGH